MGLRENFVKLPYVIHTVNVLCQSCVPMELGPCGNVCCKCCQILYYYGNYCKYCPEIRDLLMCMSLLPPLCRYHCW